jgi:hypothetical protein
MLPVFLLVWALLPIQARAGRNIMTWGENTAEWNQKLGRTGMRLGCSMQPADCAKYIRQAAASQDVDHISVSFGRDEDTPDVLENYAAQYSSMSRSVPQFTEISLDDFVRRYKHVYMERKQYQLAKVISLAKSVNKGLKFGITLYEDELKEPALSDMGPARNDIDTVYLYLHYRKSAPNFERYVSETRQWFPHAQIIAGSYALDREDYLPCAERGFFHCSDDEELQGYRNSIEKEAQLLKNGLVDGLEFWPGNFGMEDQWDGWEHPRWCRPDRRKACIANTKKMRQIAAEALQQLN